MPDSFPSVATAAPIACWSCGNALGELALFCHGCGSVQPARALDPFRRLGFAPEFDLDLDRLESQYLGFQRALHPDRFARKSPRERALAEGQAVSLNEAYGILKDPLRRALALIALKSGKPDETEDMTIADREILSEAMAWRESLGDAATIAAKETILAEAGAGALALLAELSRAFAHDDLAAAARIALRFRYLRKFLEDGAAHLAALDG